MAVYYVDDGGDNSTGADWATAYTSINSLDTAVALASGDIVYFGADSQCQAVNSANLTITGPASGLPVRFISVTQGTTTYAQASANQIDTTEGAYTVIFNGSFALYGIKVASGGDIYFVPDSNESFYSEDAIYAPAADGSVNLGNNSESRHKNMTVDLTADGTTDRSSPIFESSGTTYASINGLEFVNAGYRTGAVFNTNSMNLLLTGGDFSGFTNATACELIGLGNYMVFSNCKTAATWTAFGSRPNSVSFFYKLVNCGSADQPVSLILRDYYGDAVSSSSIYRTGGGTVESTAGALLITTEATCSVDTPFCTEWFYGLLDSTGSKTWTGHIVNDTGDLTNADAWPEVQFKADSGSGQWTTVTGKPATITTTPTAQTDDTTSTWNGTGPAFTYMQKLEVTATVNQTGQWRARLCFGKASVSAASNLYADQDVTVA